MFLYENDGLLPRCEEPGDVCPVEDLANTPGLDESARALRRSRITFFNGNSMVQPSEVFSMIMNGLGEIKKESRSEQVVRVVSRMAKASKEMDAATAEIGKVFDEVIEKELETDLADDELRKQNILPASESKHSVPNTVNDATIERVMELSSMVAMEQPSAMQGFAFELVRLCNTLMHERSQVDALYHSAKQKNYELIREFFLIKKKLLTPSWRTW